ncbi:MAG: SufD family Fe-S cluster assembly protein, partial [Verrucomicrobia bacterium]|nr:SufD family Fe-S cluster assembly protein [Verrucomicrobiota bacterium]
LEVMPSSRYMELVLSLTETMLELFYDDEGDKGGFYYTGEKNQEDLILRPRSHFDGSVPSGSSVAVTNLKQQADTGTKMIHIGKNTRSTIVSKGISAGRGQNSYRGLVQIQKSATNARNFSQCDSMLIGDQCGAHTFPYIELKNSTAKVEHEATTSKIGEDQIFYCNQRGIETQDAVNMIVNGYCKEVFNQLPMEFAVEAQKLLNVSLEGSVG